MYRRSASEMRVLILAPVGRDASLLERSLEPLNVERTIAPDISAFLRMMVEGVGCGLVTEEAFTAEATDAVQAFLESQPPWSDTPILLLTVSGHETRQSRARADRFRRLGNVTLIERPVRPDTIRSSVRAALRARMRQYEIRSRQEDLIQANADLEQFAHSASHDLREPLRTISIYSDLIVRRHSAQLNQEGKEFLSLIRTSACRMDELLDDLLAYAQASSISEEGLPEITAKASLDVALRNLSVAIEESQAELEIGEMPMVRMRPSHLSQVFQNLLGNAIKYRVPEKRVRIQVTAEFSERVWKFRVSDNGIGVPENFHEAIFGIFKRLHTSAEYTGTGMGLAICKRIVERYSGRIWVETNAEGGSDFVFTVPAAGLVT